VDTIQVAPYTSESIKPILTTSAQAAAKACSDNGSDCAFVWNGQSTSGGSTSGVGQQLDALSYIQGLLVGQAVSPVTVKTGGNATSTTGTGTGTGSPTTSGSGVATVSKSAGIAMELGQSGIGLLLGVSGTMACLMI